MDRPHLPMDVKYVNWPMLDGAAVGPAEMREVAKQIEALPRPLLIHCAKGHGRTSMIAAAWLLTTGRATTVDNALQQIRRARPLAHPNPTQTKALAALVEDLRGSEDLAV